MILAHVRYMDHPEWLDRTVRLDDTYDYDYGKVREVRFKATYSGLPQTVPPPHGTLFLLGWV